MGNCCGKTQARAQPAAPPPPRAPAAAAAAAPSPPQLVKVDTPPTQAIEPPVQQPPTPPAVEEQPPRSPAEVRLQNIYAVQASALFANGLCAVDGEVQKCQLAVPLYIIARTARRDGAPPPPSQEDANNNNNSAQTEEVEWYVYNDSPYYVAHIDCRFGPDSHVRAGDADVRLDDTADGWHKAHVVVYPLQTVSYVVGSVNGYKCAVHLQRIDHSGHHLLEVRAAAADASAVDGEAAAAAAAESAHLRDAAANTRATHEAAQRALDAVRALCRDSNKAAHGDDATADNNNSNEDDAAAAEEALRQCLQHGLPFVDVTFAPTQAMLARDGVDARHIPAVAIARPSQMDADNKDTTMTTTTAASADGNSRSNNNTAVAAAEARQYAVIRGPVLPQSVAPGYLGDTWLTSAIALLAEDEAAVRRSFVCTRTDEAAAGAYRVQINKHGWWRTVLVDDYLPMLSLPHNNICVGDSGLHSATTRTTAAAAAVTTTSMLPLGARSIDDAYELWPSLLQKAYAKLHGSYAAITGGDVLQALQDLTGCAAYRFSGEWQRAAMALAAAAAAAVANNNNNAAAVGGGALTKSGSGGKARKRQQQQQQQKKQQKQQQQQQQHRDALRALVTRLEHYANDESETSAAEGYMLVLSTPGPTSTTSSHLAARREANPGAFADAYVAAGLQLGCSYRLLSVVRTGAAAAAADKATRHEDGGSSGGDDDKDEHDGSNVLLQLRGMAGLRARLDHARNDNNTNSTADATTAHDDDDDDGHHRRRSGSDEAHDVWWMSLREAMQFFDGVGVLYRRPRTAVEVRVRGGFAGVVPTVALHLRVQATVPNVMLMLSQHDKRGVPTSQAEALYAPILLCLARYEGGGNNNNNTSSRHDDEACCRVECTTEADPERPRMHHRNDGSEEKAYTFAVARDVAMRVTLQAGCTYVLLPRIHPRGVALDTAADYTRSYTLTMQSDTPLRGCVAAELRSVRADSRALVNLATFAAADVAATTTSAVQLCEREQSQPTCLPATTAVLPDDALPAVSAAAEAGLLPRKLSSHDEMMDDGNNEDEDAGGASSGDAASDTQTREQAAHDKEMHHHDDDENVTMTTTTATQTHDAQSASLHVHVVSDAPQRRLLQPAPSTLHVSAPAANADVMRNDAEL